MKQNLSVGDTIRPSFGVGWLVVPLVLVAVDMVLELSNTTTQITPDQGNILSVCFALGGLGALLLGGVAFFGNPKMKTWHRACLTIAFAVAGFLSVFLLSSRVAELVENHIDFPAGSTKTFSAFLRIDRAYRVQGKGESWHIQTTPIWSDLDINEVDYKFMLSHRRPGDYGPNENEVASKSYFCAKVLMQQSGNALRILNAGRQRLSAGTVMLCPATSVPPTAD